MYPLPICDYKVMVVVLTYNHEKFIEDALKGIVMQQTNFPVVACVLDDCSTDGTADVVRRYEAQYPDLIKGVYFEENQLSQGKFTYEALIPWLGKVKFIALCEGDDYWTDPLKLQKQVDFMESHQDCVLCFHNALEHWEDGSEQDEIFSNVQDREYSGVEFLDKWIIPTSSCLARSEVSKDTRLYDIMTNPSFVFHDTVLFLLCGTLGAVYGMKDVMSVYRRNYNSDSFSVARLTQQSVEMNKRFSKHFVSIANYFECYYGKNIRSICEKYCLAYNVKGAKVALLKNQYGHFFRLFYDSLHVSVYKTCRNYLGIAKWIVSNRLRSNHCIIVD